MLNGELIVFGVFVLLIGFLILFGDNITGFSVYEGEVFDGKLNIEVGNSYVPGETIDFRVVLYDDNNNKINGEVGFEIQNYYTDVMQEGVVESGESVSFELPENAIRGHWAIIARYKSLEKKVLFNVMELEKIDIKLEGDKLIISNIGNIHYTKSIQISIGEHKETALVPLGVGESKEIKLTGDGVYDIRVSDGSEENDLVFKGVSLTGNVVGLEKTSSKSFFKKNPLISLFLSVIIVAGVIVGVLRMRKEVNIKK